MSANFIKFALKPSNEIGIRAQGSKSQQPQQSKSIRNVFEEAQEKSKSESAESVSYVTSVDSKGSNWHKKFESSDQKLSAECQKKSTLSNRPSHFKPIYLNPRVKGKSSTKEKKTESKSRKDSQITEEATEAENSVDEEDIADAIARDVESVLKARAQQSVSEALLAAKPLLAASKPQLFALRKRHKGCDSNVLFKAELQSLPSFSHTSFDHVPVESFGLALLKEMGYDSTIHTTKPVEYTKRLFARAGLGADSELYKVHDKVSQRPRASK